MRDAGRPAHVAGTTPDQRCKHSRRGLTTPRPWLPAAESPILRGRVLRQGVAVLGKPDEVDEVVHSIRMEGLTSLRDPARRKSCRTKGRMDEIGVGVPSLGANG
jgi:hypothetical protein